MLILQNNFPFCFSHAKSACTYYQIKKEAYFFLKKNWHEYDTVSSCHAEQQLVLYAFRTVPPMIWC